MSSSSLTPADFVRSRLSASPFLAALRAATQSRPSRPINSQEVLALESAGCSSDDWSLVRVLGDSLGVGMIKDCVFQGSVEMAAVAGSKVSLGGRRVPCGLYNSVLDGVVVEAGSLVRDCALVADVVVRSGACLVRCGVVTGSPSSSLGNGHPLPLADETGSRETKQFAELTVEVAAKVAARRSTAAAYHVAVDAYVRAVEAGVGGKTVVDEGAQVVFCPSVSGSYIGPMSEVRNSTVADCTLMGSNKAIDCHVTKAILQKGAGVESFGVVEGATLCVTVHVERHGKVFDSIIGPCSGIAEGEVTASLLGPFVGFHHQALLIAAFWPAGRGNVGYGANVGSNHTGKAPDQELWAGEGTFFGLATNIKFPANLTDSPYALIATGVSCLPQAMGLPFCLVNSPTESVAGISPSINEVTPGWMLSDNMYSLLRSEAKFEQRQSKLGDSSVGYQSSVFRPEIMDRVLKARDALAKVEPSCTKLKDSRGQPVYTDRHISIIGKNWMRESARAKAVATYTTFLQWYAIRGLWRRLSAGGRKMTSGRADEAGRAMSSVLASLKSPPLVDLSSLYDNLTVCRESSTAVEEEETQWGHEAKTLLSECADPFAVSVLLRWFGEQNLAIAQSCVDAKKRDDQRGAKIIGKSYTEAHEKAEDNKVCKTAIAEALKVREEIEAFLATSKL